MSALADRMQSDLTESIRSRDELRSATLRMALSAIKNESVSGATARELTDDEVIGVLAREAKKRREAAEAFDGAGHQDRADRERAEGTVLAEYLPESLSDDEVRALVADAVAAAAANGQTGMKAMGSVMKTLGPQVKGRADGSFVADSVKAALAAS